MIAYVTAGIALVAVVLSGLAYKREANRDDRTLQWDHERREREERAEQADLVAAWCARKVDVVQPDPHTMTMAEAAIFAQAWGAQVVNNSQLPVYKVEATFTFGDEPAHQSPIDVGVLPPGKVVFVDWPDSMRQDSTITGAEELVGVVLRFKDTAGRVWERDPEGVLHLLRRDRRVLIADHVGVADSTPGV